MKMPEVRKRAKGLGLTPGRIKKVDLIRLIQKTEGNNPCFGYGQQECDQFNCCWREDCLGSKSRKVKKQKK
ncbi:SAP domain-containing protein [Candidatus Dependentiae bacterium]|nr:SAP domain-containing protein [Candidatus Dependentiae bacterium]